jgi:hypothetical protein
MADQFQYVKMPDGSYGKFAADATPESMRAAVQQHFPDAYKPAAPAQPAKSWNDAASDSIADPSMTPDARNTWQGQLERFGQGTAEAITNPFLHPIKTAGSLLEQTPPGMLFDAVTGRKNAGQQMGQSLVDNPANTLGQLAGGAILGHVAGGAMQVPGALDEFRTPDTDVQAMKGLRVPAGSNKANRILGNVETAKPFLKGANTLEDLQSRIPGAKEEVYAPYKQAIDAMQHQTVGNSTVGDLFNRDKEITAQLGNIKNDPLAMQQAAQKGLTQADLLDEQKSIRSQLFPLIEQAGVDVPGLNKTYGALKGIEKQIAGRNTVSVPDEPQGFGRLKNLSIKEPLKFLDQAKPAAQDILNGRFWSGNPVDTAIQDAFKTSGPKPSFGKYQPPARLQLPAEASPDSAGDYDLAEPHGQVFPRMTASILKRADLY